MRSYANIEIARENGWNNMWLETDYMLRYSYETNYNIM